MDMLEHQRRAHLIHYLCGMGCKITPVLEMDDRVSVYLIIVIIIRLYIAINEVHKDVKQNSFTQVLLFRINERHFNIRLLISLILSTFNIFSNSNFNIEI